MGAGPSHAAMREVTGAGKYISESPSVSFDTTVETGFSR